MLSISKMTAGAERYYDALASEDYYLDGGEPPGLWRGRGAEALGLSGTVQSEEFRGLFQGHLRGKSLVRGGSEHTPGWDLTFSAPKSVSVAWSQADQEMALQIRAAQQEAVEKALSYLEAECGITRRGRGGHKTERAQCVFSTFEHGVNREQQPQLHTHALLLNVCVREDGTTGTLSTQRLYGHKMAAGAIYRAELASQLEARLGFSIMRSGSSFQIRGVSESLCDHFSARRHQILDALEQQGVSGAVASAWAALATRTAKTVLPRSELFARWREVGDSYGWGAEQARELLGKTVAQPAALRASVAGLLAQEALDKVMQSASWFTEKDLVRTAAEAAQGMGPGAEDVLAAVRKFITESAQIENLGATAGEVYFTTREHRDLERTMMEQVKNLAAKPGLNVRPKALEKAIQGCSDKGRPLTEEQSRAVKEIANGNRITAIVGDAGTGKTSVLKPVREALEASGYRVRGAALAAKAAQGMELGAGIESQTIASLVWSLEMIDKGWSKQEAEKQFKAWVAEEQEKRGFWKGREFSPKFNDAVARRSWERFRKYKNAEGLDENTVLVIDEAGMVDTKSLAKLIHHAEKAGSKIVFIGDPKQLQAITQGGGFREITEVLGCVRLTEVFRQKNEAEREAVKAMARGEVQEALARFAEKGNLAVLADQAEAERRMVHQWAASGVALPQENLMLASTNAEVLRLNQAAQERRRQAGVIDGKSVRAGDYDLHCRDRVVFTKNNKSLGVKNGDFGVVRHVDASRGLLTVDLDSDRTRTVSVKEYPHLSLGYCTTTHKAQGVTVKNAYVLTGESMINRQMSYVQMSRAENRTQIFTTRTEAGQGIDALAAKMARDHEKSLALSVQRRIYQESIHAQQTL